MNLKHSEYFPPNLKIDFPISYKQVSKVQSCKLYFNKYMIASTQITKAEIFALIAVLDSKLLSHKVLFINRKDNRKLLKSRLLFKKIVNFTGKLQQNYK